MTVKETIDLFNHLKKKAHIHKAKLRIYNSNSKDINASTNILTRTVRVSKASLIRLNKGEISALLGHELGHIYYSNIRGFLICVAILIPLDIFCMLLTISTLFMSNINLLTSINFFLLLVLVLNMVCIQYIFHLGHIAGKAATKFGSDACNGKEVRADLFSVKLVGANNNISLFKILKRIQDRNLADNKEYMKKSKSLPLFAQLQIHLIQGTFHAIGFVQNSADPHPKLNNRIKIIKEYSIKDLHQNPYSIQNVSKIPNAK